MIGLIFDSRLLKSRYVCFLFLILIQILVYYYLDLVPLLIIKDIFWFTAIINVSVIIHLFLFEWLLNLFKWLNYDFGVYYITRICLLTSLCSIHIYIYIIQGYLHSIIYSYYLDLYNINVSKKNECKYIFIYLINFCFALIIVLTIFFQLKYINYTKLILGTNDKINLKEIINKAIQNKILFLFLFIGFFLSFLFETKRFYVMLILLLGYKFFLLFFYLYNNNYMDNLKKKDYTKISSYVYILKSFNVFFLDPSIPFNKDCVFYYKYYYLNDNFYNEFRDILLNCDCSLFISGYWIRVNPNSVWLYFVYDKDRVFHYSILSILNIHQPEDGFFELDEAVTSVIDIYKLSNKYTIKSYCDSYLEYMKKWKPCCNFEKDNDLRYVIGPYVKWKKNYDLKTFLLLDYGFFVNKEENIKK